MPETVEYLKEKGIIQVLSYGKTSLDDWEKSLKQVLDINKKTGNKSVLVDVTKAQTAPGTFDIFEFGKNLPPGIRFAIITPATTILDHEFLATVGKNRHKSIHIFHSYEEGVSWLKGYD